MEAEALLFLVRAIVLAQKLRRAVRLARNTKMGRALLLLATDLLVNLANIHVDLDVLNSVGRYVDFELEACGLVRRALIEKVVDTLVLVFGGPEQFDLRESIWWFLRRF